MRKVKIGLIGFGTVEAGVVKIFAKKSSFVSSKKEIPVELVKVADKDRRSRRSINIPKSQLTPNANDILNDPNIDIVVELIGGIHPAKEFILKALNNGKHVVTANKALLADSGRELFEAAAKNGVAIKFEGSVGGGIPVIKCLSDSFIANKIQAIYGIINGTSNYILSKMEEEGKSFREALRDAQELGIAERNPALDISGMDSAHKIAILSLLGFGRFIDVKDMYVEGIEDVELCDIQYAKELGYTIKLLAIAKNEAGGLDVRVHPTLLSSQHLLASVKGSQNAIYIKGDLIGESLLYGEGAGERATSSAVFSDIIDIAECVSKGSEITSAHISFNPGMKVMKRIGMVKSKYYIRFMAIDKPGVLAAIAGILADFKISIADVTQKDRNRRHAVPIVMMTHEAVEADLRKALSMINKFNFISGKPVAVRMEMS
ncbi:MAG: homoserine dehydrogenase [Candidatus Omnitrophica bacterium]|nr:homoserine dehydrogenase [Candidatus Omnitrophota bacterium]